MHNVQPPIQFTSNFTPEGCSSNVGPTLTYGAGQGFQGIYETAHAHGVMAIGGTSPTVGASGGWVTGGGHSALSPTYGLGVDNVMQMRAVLPNGSFVTANRCQNQDLFFALRGGGGGTFAVLMETTSRVYPEVPLQVCTWTSIRTCAHFSNYLLHDSTQQSLHQTSISPTASAKPSRSSSTTPNSGPPTAGEATWPPGSKAWASSSST